MASDTNKPAQKDKVDKKTKSDGDKKDISQNLKIKKEKNVVLKDKVEPKPSKKSEKKMKDKIKKKQELKKPENIIIPTLEADFVDDRPIDTEKSQLETDNMLQSQKYYQD